MQFNLKPNAVLAKSTLIAVLGVLIPCSWPTEFPLSFRALFGQKKTGRNDTGVSQY